MAKKNYKSINPIGQIDPTACWMACLCWWLKAARNQNKRQLDIISLFGPIWSNEGTIDAEKLKSEVIKHNAIFKMNIQEIFPNNLEHWADGSLPLLIGFRTPGGTGHMNVIHGFNKETRMVEAMEPWFPNLPIEENDGNPYVLDNAKFTGKHVERNFSYYNSPLRNRNTLLIGTPQ